MFYTIDEAILLLDKNRSVVVHSIEILGLGKRLKRSSILYLEDKELIKIARLTQERVIKIHKKWRRLNPPPDNRWKKRLKEAHNENDHGTSEAASI